MSRSPPRQLLVEQCLERRKRHGCMGADNGGSRLAVNGRHDLRRREPDALVDHLEAGVTAAVAGRRRGGEAPIPTLPA